ncbi:dienelactone hydrolase family protein [Stutzerimonas balearica]|jgi:dienelactone hydrolase|uniref:Hydrolase n=3 Tax=Stutzerimonas TaxID=2901164 RepID=A0A8D4BZZ5_9GAMM|nr:alpha/beta family hydrolase [Stutzerimonas balearica]MBB59667.1 alpha/beta hydrolase [Pseudomonas sp.]AJE13822.1 hydrolase [Stutzerimonas balearica DSM 6083]MBC7197845.1 dienelactone hydrolase family protein [Stutzerimonas balearica]MBD3735353.1 dienelactone hydrolase family protein [Stutzerimonas balearica]MBK3746663.1 alpha/beta hydrolase [Stutzerimonas balearica]
MNPLVSTPMRFTLGRARLHGDLRVPPQACGLVVFVHGSGSSRHSPRNRNVARYFNERGLATLLFDLLTTQEQPLDELTRRLRFDIPLLSQRLTGVVDQLRQDAGLRELRIGLFGASTGAAAALITAASRPADIAAVVSRGGRVDLAADALEQVHAPTLFIVGGRDHEVLRLNRDAAARLRCPHQLTLVEGATHLFDEPGSLQEVARLAGDWFVRQLAP